MEKTIRRENYVLLKLTLEHTKLDLCGYELKEDNVSQKMLYEITDSNNLNIYENENVKMLEKKNNQNCK